MTMNLTRRETLAGAIALLCGMGAAEAQARAGMPGHQVPRGSQFGAEPDAHPAAKPESPVESRSATEPEAQGAERAAEIGRASCRKRVERGGGGKASAR